MLFIFKIDANVTLTMNSKSRFSTSDIKFVWLRRFHTIILILSSMVSTSLESITQSHNWNQIATTETKLPQMLITSWQLVAIDGQGVRITAWAIKAPSTLYLLWRS